jgi:uncharacterized membrane protein
MDRSLLTAILLLIHVGGAIVGFGPVFTFAVIGGRLRGAGPGGTVALLEAIVAIERRLILPIAVFFQPASGLALIFVAGLNEAFLSHTWLWVGILLYAIAFYLSIFVQIPAIERMIELAKAGGPPSPAFMALAQRTQRVGPLTTILLTVIIVLMITRPGG